MAYIKAVDRGERLDARRIPSSPPKRSRSGPASTRKWSTSSSARAACMTPDPTIKPIRDRRWRRKTSRCCRSSDMMKEFNIGASGSTTAMSARPSRSSGLDYDKQLPSFDNYKVKGDGHVLQRSRSPIPRKAGEIWVDGEGIEPFSAPACTLLGAYRRSRPRARRSTWPTSSTPPRHQAVRRPGLFCRRAGRQGRRSRRSCSRRMRRNTRPRTAARWRASSDALKVGDQRRLMQWTSIGAQASIDPSRLGCRAVAVGDFADRSAAAVRAGAGARRQRCDELMAGRWLSAATPAELAGARSSALHLARALFLCLAPADQVPGRVLHPLHQRAVAREVYQQPDAGGAATPSFSSTSPQLPPHSASASCIATAIARSARPGDGPIPAACAIVFMPVVGGPAADPRHRLGADVDHAVADQRGEHRLHHLHRLVLPDPAQHLHGMQWSIGCWYARRNAWAPARRRSSAKVYLAGHPCRTSSPASPSAWAWRGCR